MKSSKCSESRVIHVSKENCLCCLLLHGMGGCTGQKYVVHYEIDLQMVSLETWQCCWLFHENQAQKPSRVLSPIGQRSWDVSWRWNTWAWREERARAASECHNLEAIENTGGEVHVAITASCNISENAYTDDFRKEGDVMVQMAVHSLLFPEKAEVYDVWKKYIR